MLWLLLAILSRLFWAGTNFVEQYLSRAHAGQNVITPLVLTLLLALPAGLVCLALSGFTLWSPAVLLYSCGAAAAVIAGMVPYFYVLRREQAHNVIPYLELTPVFVILLSILIKHQELSRVQGVGAALVVGSSFLFSWNFREGRFKFSTLLLLSGASLGFALFQFLNAEAGAESSALFATGVYYVLQFFIGLAVIACSKTIRTEMIATAKRTQGRTVGFGLLSAFLDGVALVAIVASFRLAPSYGHVAALSGLQSIFCFVLALPLGRYAPQLFTPIDFDREQKIKLLLILTICAGVYLLAR